MQIVHVTLDDDYAIARSLDVAHSHMSDIKILHDLHVLHAILIHPSEERDMHPVLISQRTRPPAIEQRKELNDHGIRSARRRHQEHS